MELKKLKAESSKVKRGRQEHRVQNREEHIKGMLTEGRSRKGGGYNWDRIRPVVP